MPLISMETRINAPVEKVFDMARNVQVHCQTASWTNERVVQMGKSALLEKGDSVTFEAKHLGKKRKLTSRVTNFEPPESFTDKMVKGPFKSFSHQHNFQGMPDGTTVMYDIVEYTAPGGPLGLLIDKIVLEKYLKDFLTRRNRAFKQMAEKAHADSAPAAANRNRTNPP